MNKNLTYDSADLYETTTHFGDWWVAKHSLDIIGWFAINKLTGEIIDLKMSAWPEDSFGKACDRVCEIAIKSFSARLNEWYINKYGKDAVTIRVGKQEVFVDYHDRRAWKELCGYYRWRKERYAQALRPYRPSWCDWEGVPFPLRIKYVGKKVLACLQ